MNPILLSIEQYGLTEWQQFKNSKTVKALVSLEAGAIGVFVQGVFAGTQHYDVESLKAWGLLQAGIIIAFCMRHTWAGIEAKLNGAIDPNIVKMIKQQAEIALVARMEAKNPNLAGIAKDHLSDTT